MYTTEGSYHGKAWSLWQTVGSSTHQGACQRLQAFSNTGGLQGMVQSWDEVASPAVVQLQSNRFRMASNMFYNIY